jgi:hypothetical protein
MTRQPRSNRDVVVSSGVRSSLALAPPGRTCYQVVVAIRCQVLLEDRLISLPRLEWIKGSCAKIGNTCRALACKYHHTASFRDRSVCQEGDG